MAAGSVGDEWVYLDGDSGGVAVDEHVWNSYAADNSDEEDASSDDYSDYSNEGRLERAYESDDEGLDDQVDEETDDHAAPDTKKLLDDESDGSAFDLDMAKMLDELSSIADRRKAARTPATGWLPDHGYGGPAYQDDLLPGPAFSESLYGGNSGCDYGGGGCYGISSNYYRGGRGYYYGGGNGGLSDFDYGSGRDDGGLCDFDYGSGRGYYDDISEFDYGSRRGYHGGLFVVFDYGSRRDYYGGMSDCGYPHGPNLYLGGLQYLPYVLTVPKAEAPEAELASWT